MRKRRGSGFFAGIFVGVLFSMTFFLVMYFLDIQILPASSLASDIRNRAEIVESYIDSYYWMTMYRIKQFRNMPQKEW